MCMAVPGRVVGKGIVEISGSRKRVKFAVPGLQEGDYVLVHAGVAIQKLSRADYEALLRSAGSEI